MGRRRAVSQIVQRSRSRHGICFRRRCRTVLLQLSSSSAGRSAGRTLSDSLHEAEGRCPFDTVRQFSVGLHQPRHCDLSGASVSRPWIECLDHGVSRRLFPGGTFGCPITSEKFAPPAFNEHLAVGDTASRSMPGALRGCGQRLVVPARPKAFAQPIIDGAFQCRVMGHPISLVRMIERIRDRRPDRESPRDGAIDNRPRCRP